MRAFVRAAAFMLSAFGVAACSGGRVVDVEVETRAPTAAEGAAPVGVVRIAYGGLFGLDALILGPVDRSRWTVETTGVVLRSDDGKRRLEPAAKGGTLPAVVVVAVTPAPFGAPAAATTIGGGGFIVSSDAIRPMTEGLRVRLSFTAPSRGVVAARAEAAPRLADWRNDGAPGRDVFIGSAERRATEGGVFVFEASTPGWIRSEAARLAGRLAPAFAAATGRKPGRPDVFVGLRSEGDAFAWRGAARDGQIALEFLGPNWRDSGPDAGERLQRAVASELAAAELEDLAARKPPAWIADGIADALADEAMTAAGVWSTDDAARIAADATARCAALLASTRLEDLARAGEAARPCGHAFARAGAGGKGVAAFARDFGKGLARAEGAPPAARAGADAFLRVAAKHAGAHNAALMRTLMSATGVEARDALAALKINEARPEHAR